MKLAVLKEDFFFSLRHPHVRAGIAGIVTSFLLGAVTGMAYWWPIAHESNRLTAQIDEQRRKIANADFEAQLAKASDRAVRQMAAIEKKLDVSLTQATLMQNIAALARRHKVSIVSEAYEEGNVKGDFLPLVHNITVQAGYPELRRFIAGVQELPTFTIVQEAVLSRSSRSSIIKAQLNIITYRRTAQLRP